MTIRGAAVRFIALLALPLMVGCAQATPTPTAAPPRVTPAAERDIREQIVEAIQRPGFVTKVRISITPPGEEARVGSQTETTTAWIDLPGRRAHVESRTNGREAHVSIVHSEMEVTYNREINTLEEHPFSMRLPQEVAQTLPSSLNNPVLLGLGPLFWVLVRSHWRPLGGGYWEEAPAAIWEVDFPGGTEGATHTYATIYLDANTQLPLGEQLAFAQEGSTAEFTYLVTYRFEFVAPEAVPEEVFDVQELRELQQNYGGKLDESRSLDFTLVWLGKEFDLGEDYPKLQLTDVRLRQRDLEGRFASFSYRVPRNGSVDSQGQVDVVVWQRDLWESLIQKNAPPDAWWRDPELRREEIAFDGVTVEFAIGPLASSGRKVEPLPKAPGNQGGQVFQIPTRDMELRLWLTDSVVFIYATPIRPTQFPAMPPEKWAAVPPIAVTPDLGSAYDLNVFNTEETMRALVQALEVLR